MSQVMLGGTAIGIRTDKYVVLGSDKMYLTGNLAFSNDVKKLYRISDNSYLAAAGLIADMQELVREVRYVLGNRKMLLGRDVSVRSTAKVVSVILYGNKGLPLYTQLLIGGYDVKPRLYSLDSLGSVMEDDYVAIGSGAETAIGVVDNAYNTQLTADELEKLVLDAFRSVARRDVLTGYVIDLVIISRSGAKEKRVSLM